MRLLWFKKKITKSMKEAQNLWHETHVWWSWAFLEVILPCLFSSWWRLRRVLQGGTWLGSRPRSGSCPVDWRPGLGAKHPPPSEHHHLLDKHTHTNYLAFTLSSFHFSTKVVRSETLGSYKEFQLKNIQSLFSSYISFYCSSVYSKQKKKNWKNWILKLMLYQMLTC